VASWTFLTYHARVLLLVAPRPGIRLRDIAASLNITERSVCARRAASVAVLIGGLAGAVWPRRAR
jgi:putative heme degradation protein